MSVNVSKEDVLVYIEHHPELWNEIYQLIGDLIESIQFEEDVVIALLSEAGIDDSIHDDWKKIEIPHMPTVQERSLWYRQELHLSRKMADELVHRKIQPSVLLLMTRQQLLQYSRVSPHDYVILTQKRSSWANIQLSNRNFKRR